MITCPVCAREVGDDMGACSACGAALARPCRRCGHSNAAASNFCSNCGLALRSAATGSAYTPRHIAEKILSSRTALEGERKQVTVLFLDIKDSVKLSRATGAEEWHRVLEGFFALVAQVVHRFEGTINQYTGDGVMALFGAPLAHEDHAHRACHTALGLRERLREFGRELRRDRGLRFGVRIGINSGEVVVGRIGDDLRMDYTALGDTVGLASRMEQMAPPDRIYLTQHTAALVDGFFELEDLGIVRVKGIAEPVRAHALVASGQLRTRLDASRSRGFTRFLGRAGELSELGAALERAQAGNAQVIGVVGAAGVGKSRLCQEFADACRADGILVAQVHCPAHGRSIPWLGIAELLRSYFGIAAGETPRQARQRVELGLRRLGRGLREEMPLVLDLLGLPQRRPLALDPASRRERLAVLASRLVQTQSAESPLMLLIDDAHWLDAESDELLGRLIGAVGWTRTLLLLNFRPEYRPAWAGVSYCHRVEIEPLSPAACDELLSTLLGSEPSTAELRALIRERSAGNPLFVEEILHSLAQDGFLERNAAGVPGSTYETKRPISAEDLAQRVPATVQALLAARVDRLPEAAKTALQIAAVAGKVFARALLCQVSSQLQAPGEALAEGEIESALAALVEADFIRPAAGEALAFVHPLAQEVAYQSQLRDRRCKVHEAMARALESLYPERLGEHAALIAHHWSAADQRGEASRWRYRAALRVTNIQLARRPKS